MKIDMPCVSFNKHFARARGKGDLRRERAVCGEVSLLEEAIRPFIKGRARVRYFLSHPVILVED